jgi:hypothetical protein
MPHNSSRGEALPIAQCEEMVQLGDLCAPATLTDGEVLLIRFSLSSLGREQLRLVNHLKLYPHSVVLALGKKRLKGDHHIIGFEEKTGSVTFHVARNKPALPGE